MPACLPGIVLKRRQMAVGELNVCTYVCEGMCANTYKYTVCLCVCRCLEIHTHIHIVAHMITVVVVVAVFVC